jgi:hypothetical protein
VLTAPPNTAEFIQYVSAFNALIAVITDFRIVTKFDISYSIPYVIGGCCICSTTFLSPVPPRITNPFVPQKPTPYREHIEATIWLSFDAMRPSNSDTVSRLILNGSDVNATNSSGLTVVQYAARDYFSLRPTALPQKKSRLKLWTQHLWLACLLY